MATVISARAAKMIEGFEISSPEVYMKQLARPTWPGGSSGVTIGIGYDLGYNTVSQIHHDFGGLLDPAVIPRLEALAGITGVRAQAILPTARDIAIPYDVASYVYEHDVLPRYTALTLKTFPRLAEVSADCLGAMTSVVYNRGNSLAMPDEDDKADRRLEMRIIADLIKNGNFRVVSVYIRDMKRLWKDAKGNPLPGMAGLIDRREQEALLWLAGLQASAVDEAEFVATAPWPDLAQQALADATDAAVESRLRDL